MRGFSRTQRVAQLLREEINTMIQRDLKDPLIGMATISEVRVTEDLKHARVYVSIIGDEEARSNTLTGLERARSRIRGELGRRLDLRHIPQLEFVLDRSAEYAQNIEALLQKLRQNA